MKALYYFLKNILTETAVNSIIMKNVNAYISNTKRRK